MATTAPPFSSHYLACHEVGEYEKVCSAGRYGNIDSKCGFFTLNQFVHESRRGFTASTNYNAVQPQVWWKPVLFLRVKTVVRGFDQMI